MLNMGQVYIYCLFIFNIFSFRVAYPSFGSVIFVTVYSIGQMPSPLRFIMLSTEFIDIVLFHIEADNVNFIGNELKDYTVTSREDGTDQFRGYFMDGFGTPGKVIKLLCKGLKIFLE